MGLFSGKKLLVLGSNIASVDIVEYAKSEGAYVIVTDYLPKEKSQAKMHADKDYMISTVDIDKLTELIKEENIDGVFCGVSEVNLQSVQKVTEIVGLPCYFTKEQWNLCENKANFKELCFKYGVPTAKQYCISNDNLLESVKKIEYPVIVKPVDLCASRGIHICYNETELLEGYIDSYNKSPSNSVIVEQYLYGDEISATYDFVNGECRLSLFSQMYYNTEQTGLVPLPDAYIYPSKHLTKFIETVNNSMIKMLKSLDLKNGTVFVTGIANENGFSFFEAGLRIAGTAPYRFLSELNGINTMKLMTEYALNGEIANRDILKLEDPYMKGKHCCLFSLLNKGGIIAEISGVDKAADLPGVISYTIQRGVGDEIKNDGTLGQVNIRFYIVKDTIEEIRETIVMIQKIVNVKDSFGQGMLLKSNVVNVL